MVIHLMNSNRFVFILFIIINLISYSISKTDKCSGRWQIIDKLNIKVTLDWQILPTTNQFVTEFRTNFVAKGFWHGFGFSSSSNTFTNELVYTLRRRENDTEIFWDIYNITDSNVINVKENRSSSVTFQRLFSSGLLTVRPNLNLSQWNNENKCLYFVYMRGRFKNDQPLLPEEIHFNQSTCIACQRIQLLSTTQIQQDMTTQLMIENDTTMYQTVENDITTTSLMITNEFTSQFTSMSTSVPLKHRTAYKLIWFGRITNRAWLNDYLDLHSSSSQNLRLDLENLFLFLINHNSSFSFICNQFELYSLQSGSILFASNITLISNLSEEQTINAIEDLIKPINNSFDYNLHFDQSAHYVVPTNEISSINILFQNLSRTVDYDYSKQIEIDSALHLLIGCIIGIGCLMVIITSILCLYGYYKCRRRQFRLFTERQTFKFKYDINSYRWLGQQPSISSSSPYLIQSTSI